MRPDDAGRRRRAPRSPKRNETVVPFQPAVPLDPELVALEAELARGGARATARRRGDQPPSGENVLDDLLAATHEDGSPLDDREVRDALITILIAGHDTTALALAWALAIDWIVWRVSPDAWTLVGAAIIVGSGIYLVRRERVHPESEHP